MGYSHFDSPKNESEGKLANSLFTVLKRDNCASFTRLDFFVNRGRFRLLNVEDDEKSLYYIDEEEEMISMSFPARLNLKGVYSQKDHNFSKVINSSIFELHPLSKSRECEIPMDAIDCSISAIEILDTIYRKAENCLRNCELPPFFFLFERKKNRK